METNRMKFFFSNLGKVSILFLIFLSSCVQNKEVIYLNDQILALNKRVNKLQESQKTEESKKGELGSTFDAKMQTLQARQAEFGVELDQVKRAIEGLSGRIEDNEHIIKRAVERDLTDQDAVQVNLTQLNRKVEELAAQITRQQQYLGFERPGGREGRGQPRGRPWEGSVPKPPAVVEDPKSQELAAYDSSLAHYKQGEYELGMVGFKKFLSLFPRSDLADNAQFWIGESYMASKQYEQAILAYQQVIKKYPKGNKVPNAMLRQAMAFLEIKDKVSFRVLLKKIINEHPKSSEAEIARRRLRKFR